MTNRQRVIHLLRNGLEPSAIAEIVGVPRHTVLTERWRLNNPEKYVENNRQRQREAYTRQAARNGRRPSNETILSLAKSHTYNQIADRFGISRNVIAGVVNRSKKSEAVA